MSDARKTTPAWPAWLELIVTDVIAQLELGSQERRVFVESAARVLPMAGRAFDADDWAVMETRLRRIVLAETAPSRFAGPESHPFLMVAGLEADRMLLAREHVLDTGGIDDAAAETHHRREAWWHLDQLSNQPWPYYSPKFGGRGRRVLDLLLVPTVLPLDLVLAESSDRPACVAALLIEIESRVADMLAVAAEAEALS